MNFNTLNEAISYGKICPVCKCATKLVNCSIVGGKLNIFSESIFNSEEKLQFDLQQKSSYRPNVYPRSIEWGFACGDYEAEFLTSFHHETQSSLVIRNNLLERESLHLRNKRYDTLVINHDKRNVTLIKGFIKETFDIYGTTREIIEKIASI